MAKRELEHDQLPIPNGWFAVAFSTELKVGEVKPVEYFGKEAFAFTKHMAEGTQRKLPHRGQGWR